MIIRDVRQPGRHESKMKHDTQGLAADSENWREFVTVL